MILTWKVPRKKKRTRKTATKSLLHHIQNPASVIVSNSIGVMDMEAFVDIIHFSIHEVGRCMLKFFIYLQETKLRSYMADFEIKLLAHYICTKTQLLH
jgi:hypothetical protein